jgi:molybdopterin adenylyltransferase
MSVIPHPDSESIALNCAVLTISDTRTFADDRSGQLLQELLQSQGHRVGYYEIVPDDPQQIDQHVTEWLAHTDPPPQVLILTGGTGIAPRDTTYHTIVGFLDQELPGFGELFRWLSFQEVGSRAMASRAVAGVNCNPNGLQSLIFSLPGSSNAVRLAMEKLILPEIVHLTRQLNA